MVSASTTVDDDSLLEERLALFARTMFVLDVFVTLVGFVFGLVFPALLPPKVMSAFAIAVAGIAVLAVVAFILRRRTCRGMELRWLDAAMTVGGGFMLGFGSFLVAESPIHTFMPFTIGILMVFARVFIVPSTPKRTLIISTAAMVGLSVGDLGVAGRVPQQLGMPFSAYMIGGIVLAVATVVLSVLGSSIIYGLRREVREALRYGQYTLDKKLGEGGMGVVFKAQHALLRRPTALKLLPPHKASAEDVARFEREVQLTAELTHPNTIAIFDYGRSTDGTFYYAMEYLDGIDLETLVEKHGALPWGRAVPILVQICEALDEAHERGVIHRDIKPANIILCRRGRTVDFVKVVDFGLVKELAKADGVTAEGTISGTPAYMSPEQLTSPETVGPASDLYAVGAVAYYLVTGKLVFEASTVVGMCAHHLNTAATPPSKRTSNAIHPELEKIVMACLEKKPASRPESARALADALLAIPRDGWTPRDATAWWDRQDLSAKPTDTPRTTGIADTIAVIPRLPPS